jgi:hypothetical protein
MCYVVMCYGRSMIIATENTDGVELTAERRGLAIISDGSLVYHAVYETTFHVSVCEDHSASVG